jgi:hypothetical protein
MQKNKELDLNIDHYDLPEILHLFQMPMNFDEQDMKRAKQIVLKTHPDKSRLDPSIFRFYSAAYKVIFGLWEFKKKGHVNHSGMNTEYREIVNEEKEKKKALDQFVKTFKKDPSQFNDWFNEQFEKNRIVSEKEKGYEDWLRSTEDGCDPVQVSNKASMNEEIEKKKSHIRSLTVFQEVQEWQQESISSYDLSDKTPTSFDSGLFSSLPFQDLQKAHTETVIPVTNDDYERKKKFHSVNEMNSYRQSQDITPLSEKQALDFLKRKEKYEEESSLQTAYHLAKQTEEAKKKEKEFWSGIQLLQNKR